MLVYYFVAIVTIFCMFALFLVLSKTMNGIINQLAKIEYLVKKEHEYREEAVGMKFLMVEEEDENNENIE